MMQPSRPRRRQRQHTTPCTCACTEPPNFATSRLCNFTALHSWLPHLQRRQAEAVEGDELAPPLRQPVGLVSRVPRPVGLLCLREGNKTRREWFLVALCAWPLDRPLPKTELIYELCCTATGVAERQATQRGVGPPAPPPPPSPPPLPLPLPPHLEHRL